jgi:SNF2 family DNA or RNA helicase
LLPFHLVRTISLPETALKERWTEASPEVEALLHRDRYRKLYDLLSSGRVEILFDEAKAEELPAAALAESPIYRGGEKLQPWQRSFATMFLQHRETYGKVRLLLADEVGLGKTLSLGASAMLAVLLDDGPVLILCPSTITMQWQAELTDKLGIASAVWSSTKKVWIDPKGHVIKTRGPEDVARCPF